MKITAQEFNSEFTQLVRQERGITREVVEMISFCMKKKFYAELGYSSVMGWLVKNHGYPKNSAYRRIEAAKLVTSVPSAIEKLEAGKVNLSTLATLQSAIRREEARTSVKIEPKRREELFSMIENKTEEQTERLVAIEFPEIIKDKIESVKPVSATETRMNLIFDAEEMAILERVREITGHSHFNASWSELVIVMAKEFVKQKDPVQKAERSIMRAEAKLSKLARREEALDGKVERVQLAKDSTDKREGRVGQGGHVKDAGAEHLPNDESTQRKGTGAVPSSSEVAAAADVSPQLRAAIIYRDDSRCTFVDQVTKRRCDCRTQLEVDHIVLRAFGGTSDPENLRTLCRAHNQFAAEIELGADFVRKQMNSKRCQLIF